MKPVCVPEKYEILGELGAGGMGQVYHARDRDLDREVALKVLANQYALHSEFVQRFQTEARAAARLNHPNIVQIYDFGETDKSHYLAMELVRGKTLKIELKKVGRFSESQTLDLALVICRTLEVAHRAGIVHRDIKPDNLMFSDQGEFKLVDLGLAKCLHEDSSNTMTGQSLGTPHFISPEQITGDRPIDPRADIYSLGATLFNLATGKVPFDGTSGAHIMSRHLNDPMPDPRSIEPTLSGGFCQVVGRMMAKDPDHRYSSMAHLEKDLLELKGGGQPSPGALESTASKNTIFTAPPQGLKVSPTVFNEDESLKKVTRRLADYVGPLAKVLVRKAWSRAANWEDFTQELARKIPNAGNRTTFLGICQRIDEGGGTSALEYPSSFMSSLTQSNISDSRTISVATGVGPALSLTEAETTRIVNFLAARIGPVARTLVRKELGKAHSLDHLVSTLALAIPDETERASFIDEMASGDGSV